MDNRIKHYNTLFQDIYDRLVNLENLITELKKFIDIEKYICPTCLEYKHDCHCIE